jgi:hypothetical protein
MYGELLQISQKEIWYYVRVQWKIVSMVGFPIIYYDV